MQASIAETVDQTAEDATLGAAEAVLDRVHLTRMTLGDCGLEREVLALFDRQSELLLARIRADADSVPTLVHALKGSAGGIGAFAVARAAKAVEQAEPAARADRIDQLAAAIAEARTAIAEVLAAGRASAA